RLLHFYFAHDEAGLPGALQPDPHCGEDWQIDRAHVARWNVHPEADPEDHAPLRRVLLFHLSRAPSASTRFHLYDVYRGAEPRRRTHAWGARANLRVPHVRDRHHLRADQRNAPGAV